jgi:hypothetical protein
MVAPSLTAAHRQRELVFPGDKRRLMDMRRSGVVEVIAGDVGLRGCPPSWQTPFKRQ